MNIVQLVLFAVGLMTVLVLGYIAFAGPSPAKEGARRLPTHLKANLKGAPVSPHRQQGIAVPAE